MCISCRKREPQKELVRLQNCDGKMVTYQGRGRSFYLCRECLHKEHVEKKIAKIAKVDLKSAEELIKELRSNGKN